MPIPVQDIAKRHKLERKHLKAFFDADSIDKRPGAKKLVAKIRDTIREGIDRNRRDYRLYKAMDWAMDQPFYQVSYTQLRGLLSSNPDDKKVMETINQWGLTHLLPVKMENGRECCDATGAKIRVANVPAITNVYVPIVMAYHTIRMAKLFNDRNLVPLYKYEPVQFTKANRVRCEVVTQMVQKQSAWFDYKSDERQSISQMLQYGFCINFPRESWFVEKQEDRDGKTKIMREGLRFNMPHPSRVYYDMYNRLSTLNSNSGCEYAGYWSLERFNDIHENPLYWNKDKIAIGAHSWLDIGRSDFLSEVYPCSMSFPSLSDGNGSAGAGALDRENDSARFYNQGTANAATLKTEHFHRIVPKEYGMGTYEHPLWFRFVFASDSTVIWAEPLAFDRFPTYAYDADFNRSRFRSLTLEVTPFQDQVGNLLTQWGMAVRENLNNPVFVDEEKVPTNALTALENRGNKTFSGRQYIKFSSTLNNRFRVDQREAFYTPQMTQHNTAEIASLITGVLDMLDRVMQLSPQEIGQAASHEQTAEESRIIATNMSTRVAFTGSFVDDAIYAKKVMIYDANMAYADDEITAGISSAFAATEEEFKKLMESIGFKITDKDGYDSDNPSNIRTVTGKKSDLVLESFASNRDADTRINNPAIADAMSKIFIAVSNNPALIQSVGAVQLVELLNQIILASGLPKEFRLQGKPLEQMQPQQQGEELQKMLTGFAEQINQRIQQSQKEVLDAAGQQTQQIVGQAMQAASQQIQPIVQAVEQTASGVSQASEVNQIQQQQLETLAAEIVKLKSAMQATATLTTQTMQPAPPQNQPPIAQPIQGPPPVGVPV